jgi:hypothetical protein
MLYIHKFSSQYWDSWLDILSQQIHFEFSTYVNEPTQGTRKFFSPNKKYFITSSFDDKIVSDAMNIVLTTNSGAFYIIAFKPENEQFEIMLVPWGSFSRWWNIIKYIRFQKEQTLLMKYLDNIGQSDFNCTLP